MSAGEPSMLRVVFVFMEQAPPGSSRFRTHGLRRPGFPLRAGRDARANRAEVNRLEAQGKSG